MDERSSCEPLDRQRRDVHAFAAAADDQLRDRPTSGGRVHHPVTGEAVRKKEPGSAGSGSEHGVMIGGDLIKPAELRRRSMPASMKRRLGDGREVRPTVERDNGATIGNAAFVEGMPVEFAARQAEGR